MKRAIFPVLVLVILVVTAVVCADFYLYYRNTLHDNGRWISSKVRLARRPLASVAFLVTNVTLAQNRLNLASWQGFQEIIHKRTMNLSRLEADVFVSDSDHYSMIAVVDRHDGGFSGFALRNPRVHQSYFFHADSLGRFSDKLPCGAGEKIKVQQWNRLRLDLKPHSVKVSINGVVAGTFERRAAGSGQWGFRVDSIGDDALLDNIVARDRGGEELVETFDNRRRLLPWAAALLAALLLVNGALFGVTRRRSPWPRLLLLNCVLAVSLSALYAYYYHHLSLLYPREEAINWRGFSNRLEGEHDMGRRLIKEYGTTKKEGEYRVILLGSSQTWGEGASRDDRTLASVVERALNRDHVRLKKTFRCLNAGVRGGESSVLSQVYEEHLLKVKPDLLVVNLGNMDQDGRILGKSLERLVSLNRARGIKTVMSLEPSLKLEEGLVKKHGVMKRVAAKYGIPVVESQQFLASKRDSGFLWWDGVHLSDYGQHLLAQRMLAGIARALEKPEAESK